MAYPSALGKLFSGISLVAIGVLLSGVNYCQKSYSIGAQSSVSNTATATPTGSGDDDDDDDDGVVTATPTATATSTESIVASPTPELEAANDGVTFIKALRGLSKTPAVIDTPAPAAALPPVSGAETSDSSNWLGKIKSRKGSAAFVDSDRDGFTDEVELRYGSDPNSANSAPAIRNPSNLAARFAGVDDDLDGAPNTDEAENGIDPRLADSDGDGVDDGAELLAGTNPASSSSYPLDSDGDGAPDIVESRAGTDPARTDSDADSLGDWRELAMGTDSLVADTDGDGILDGAEIRLGTDPLIKDL